MPLTPETRALEERYEEAMEQWARMKSAHEVAVKACSAAEKAHKRAELARDHAEAACDAAHAVATELREGIRKALFPG
jgi:predicted nucleic acid-binding protein